MKIKDEEHSLTESDIKIADINFAFNNREMLLLLNKRYDYLCKAKFDKVEQIENEITRVKNEKYSQLVVPNTFYCTFMEGKGQAAALQVDDGKLDIDGVELEIKEAVNPSDIIWLNRGVSKREWQLRLVIAIIIVLVTSIGVYVFFSFEMGLQIYIKLRQSPPGVMCNQLYSVYDDANLQYLASIEYFYLEKE